MVSMILRLRLIAQTAKIILVTAPVLKGLDYVRTKLYDTDFSMRIKIRLIKKAFLSELK